MSTSSGQDSARSVAGLNELIGLALLLLHFYVYCFPVFLQLGWVNRLVDVVLGKVLRTGLFDSFWYSKLGSLGFFLLGMIAAARRMLPQERRWVWRPVLGFLLAVGSFVGLGSVVPLGYMVYMAATMICLFWALFCFGRVLRFIAVPWAQNDPFGCQDAGFPQERRRLRGRWVLHLRAEYFERGRRYSSWINLVNPRRGVLILGSPGSGKSYFIIEPLIRQLIGKGMAMMLYDYKFDTLSRVAYGCFMACHARYPAGVGFFYINCADPRRSHRCNVLAPETMGWLSDAMAVSRTILLSMNRSWIERQRDFWIESPVNFLAALIWFIHEYKGGVYCTLPHVIELSKLPYGALFEVLGSLDSVSGLIDPFVQAFTNGTVEMLDGQVAAAKIPLAKLSSPDLYYVLTGDDLKLDLNNPVLRKIFCLGGDPRRMEAIGPVISLYIDRINRLCNRPGQYPLALVADEFATIRAASMLPTMATGRSNDIVPVLAVQDLALRILYSRDEADWVFGIAGNLFCGQVGGETAMRVAERFPQVLRERASVSVNSADVSVGRQRVWEPAVTAATVAGLSSGEFEGVVADDVWASLEMKAFHARVRRGSAGKAEELPVVNFVEEEGLVEVFERVAAEVVGMVGEVRREMMEGVPGRIWSEAGLAGIAGKDKGIIKEDFGGRVGGGRMD